MFRKLIPAVLLIAAITTSAQARRLVDTMPQEPIVTFSDVRDALAKRRTLQLQRLRAYKNARLFPRNRVSDNVINVFKDEDGLLCAVANLIFLDGELDLVAKTAKDQNYVKIGTLESGDLYQWVLASGFLKEEIAAIQLPDSPVLGGNDWFVEENERIIAHLEEVENMLTNNTEDALDLAAERFMSERDGGFDKLFKLSLLK